MRLRKPSTSPDSAYPNSIVTSYQPITIPLPHHRSLTFFSGSVSAQPRLPAARLPAASIHTDVDGRGTGPRNAAGAAAAGDLAVLQDAVGLCGRGGAANGKERAVR